MSQETPTHPPEPAQIQNQIEEFRQLLLRVLQPGFSILQSDIDEIEAKLEDLRKLTANLPAELNSTRKTVQELEAIVNNPHEIAQRMKPVLGPVMFDGTHAEPDTYAGAVAHVVGPAIRIQTRQNYQDIVSALYPVIGGTISKAIAETFEDFRRTIDARLKRDFNLRARVRRFVYRIQGISTTELALRDVLPYKIKNVFLIHRDSGLLLEHLSAAEDVPDLDLISAMLEAIRNFAHDTFKPGGGEGELEEIQYGAYRILLEPGLHAYLAVVLTGSEPLPYSGLMKAVANHINFQHEKALRDFDGKMDDLPDFKSELSGLLNPPLDIPDEMAEEKGLTRGQKTAFTISLLSAMLVFFLAVFYCYYTIRLWPVVFPGPSATPTQTSIFTSTATITVTATPTRLPTFTPTLTQTPLPSATIPYVVSVTVGNVWVRTEPSASAPRTRYIIESKTPVRIYAVEGNWARITWQDKMGAFEGWIPLDWLAVSGEIPPGMVTPTLTKTPYRR